ncbi:DnaD domain protein [Paraclostridium sordellii]|uniref:DnaD domain protein n=1 Tax=Paraclostridium sordellii TaxID=1505 RepID=UPI000543E1AB|nr:DnaD domain protein [Paeniclostridium sordellii]MCQ4696498.1 DnaD domain protein [Paeniclostridium sordellii]MDU6482334.1 DnaD domain protein [Paeniclostridium sordellii]CEK34201.1 DnaD domain protein,Replication initiation and membrane attachment [[Clostridium] sordellii] [Paeniclostridium sordellii]CEN89543.1 DnaD domain protein [[Clostridium] sordellii] [Paeniclostridium sordellii]CEO23610.1 DnaD domain protein [[Clostridium] sordellii] [Paeniclostridium sordellii]
MEVKDKPYFQSTSILNEGYGLIPKKITRDKLLSLEAKAIYAYLASFAGSNGSCFPGKELMLAELATTERRFNKNIKQLKEHGYIRVYKRRKGNRNDSNLYELIMDTREIKVAREEYDTSQIDNGQFDSSQLDSNQINPPNNKSFNNNNIKNISLNNLDNTKETTIEDIINFYKREIASNYILNSIEQDRIVKLSKKIQNELFIEAMRISIKSNIKSIYYIEGIINKWLEAGITTVDKLKLYRSNIEKNIEAKLYKGDDLYVRTRKDKSTKKSTNDSRESEESRKIRLLEKCKELSKK